MPTFDALFLGSFVADVILCFFTVIIQIYINSKDENTEKNSSIVKTVVIFILIWIVLVIGAVVLAKHCGWETDLFPKLTANTVNQEAVPTAPPISSNDTFNTNPNTSVVQITSTPYYTNTPQITETPYVDNSYPSYDNTSSPSIEITNVEYSTLRVGASCDISVTVNYSCPFDRQYALMIGFNNNEVGSFTMQNQDFITNGVGSYTFQTKIVPVIWQDGTPFMVYVNISEWPHNDSWTPVANDYMILDIES